jgi:hypothetical protein
MWDNKQQTTLIVEKIEPPKAIATYSWGIYKGKEGGWGRYEWKVEPGRLEANLDKITIAYFLSENGEKLEGEYRRSSNNQVICVTMKRQPPSPSMTTLATATPTPVPANTKITPPNPEMPTSITAFSGSWHGTWDNGRLVTLIIERIEPKTVRDRDVSLRIEAIAIYSWGPLKKEPGGWIRYLGRVDPGKLELSDPEAEINITFLLSKDSQTLEGTWQKGGGKKLKATMQRQ